MYVKQRVGELLVGQTYTNNLPLNNVEQWT